MIKRLRRKFVLIVMAVVTVILLAIFLTIIMTTQRNNERMSLGMLQQALTTRPSPRDSSSPTFENNPFPPNGNLPNMRLPVLIINVDESGTVSIVTNQLHFVEDTDIEPIVELVLAGNGENGIVQAYELRYLRRNTENGMRIALADISMEKEILSTQIKNSLLVGSGSMITFFFLSLFLAHWAVSPVEVAWERQKQFIANASHELKTPLTVILSNADILRANKSFEDEKNARRMDHIHAEAMRMKKLVEDMLTLARSDNAETPNTYGLVDLSYVVKSAVLMYEPIIFNESKKLEHEIEHGFSIMGDAQKLQQTIHILLDNAIKYSNANSIISVSMRQSEQSTLLLKVENEGVPIPTHELESIFLRFYRRDDSRSEHGSFGLGLSIAQSIVNEHDGKIWAESDGISKNFFFISLPITNTR